MRRYGFWKEEISRGCGAATLAARGVSRSALILCAALTIAGCGGGGSSGSPAPAGPAAPPVPAPAPFGLTARAGMAPVSVPISGGSLGSYSLDRSFPGLTFTAAVFLAAVPGENRLVVVQQDGRVLAFTDDAAVASAELILDLSARVAFAGEKGLIGLAFDPDFQLNRYLYVHQSLANSSAPGVEHVARISRFTWDAGTDQVSLASEKVILEIDQPYGNHNGGMLAFGPDGYLYIALGDGGSGGDPQNHAQTPSDMLGSLLRIDVHPANPADAYDVPADNPFLGQAGFLPETYAYGLRNPFRFSFDRATGALWLGDVGQVMREEINIIEAGGNYGWRVYEGNLPYDDSLNTLPSSAFTFPVLDYGRTEGRAVIGGYVYRGARVPSLQGRYLYGDFSTGNIWALEWDMSGQQVLGNELIGNVGGLDSFGEDGSGDVHAVSGWGSIFQFTEVTSGSPSDPPPMLSDTGIFADLTSLTAVNGFIEYELNQPFWSDDAGKRRWIALPDGETIGFSAAGPWSFPLGTIIVKHFELELVTGDPGSVRRLETRLLVNREDGWRAFTYRWDPVGTDARLLAGRELETITVTTPGGGSRAQLYEYPSRTDCLACHTDAAGFALGVGTRQLNRTFDYPAATDNQLRSWNNIGLFGSDIGSADNYPAYAALNDASADIPARARAYLAINCAQCHQPGGGAPTTMDLRFDVAAADMNVMDVAPSAGDLGVTDARIVARGDRSSSVLWLRMTLLDGNRMPPVGSHVVDVEGAEIIGRWIDGL